MGYDVQIQRIGLNAVIELQGDADAIARHIKDGLPPFPETQNTFTELEDLTLCWIAPQRWLLRSSVDNEDRMLEMTKPSVAPADVSVVLVSDTLCFLKITGPESDEIISVACSMDHHPTVFPHNGVSFTNVFGVKGLLIRADDGFEIAVESSYADLIEDYLLRTNT